MAPAERTRLTGGLSEDNKSTHSECVSPVWINLGHTEHSSTPPPLVDYLLEHFLVYSCFIPPLSHYILKADTEPR